MFYDPFDIQDDYGEEPIMVVQGPMQLRPGEMEPEDFEFDDFGPEGLRRDRDLIDEITEAVIREAQDYNYFGRLATLTRNRQQQQVIFGIQQDEARLYRQFSNILRRLGARQPRIPAGPIPRRFEEGVREAVREELLDASFYERIANQAQSRQIRMRFMQASRDERRHAALLRNMLRGF